VSAGPERPDDLARSADRADPLSTAFDGPLVVFEPASGARPGGPIYLGGDLHAVHPRAAPEGETRPRDATLEAAMLFFFPTGQGETIESVATCGVWCLALHDEQRDSFFFLLLRDGELRVRAWLLLWPARAMLGRGHLWLPSVPPPRRRH
jgi:hypothetical protein